MKCWEIRIREDRGIDLNKTGYEFSDTLTLPKNFSHNRTEMATVFLLKKGILIFSGIKYNGLLSERLCS